MGGHDEARVPADFLKSVVMANRHTTLTTDEQMIFSRLAGRRAFLGATAGATLAALAGHEPRSVQAQKSR